MAQALGSLPSTWETWIEFLAPGFGPGPVLAVVDIWSVKQYVRVLSASPKIHKMNNKKREQNNQTKSHVKLLQVPV